MHLQKATRAITLAFALVVASLAPSVRSIHAASALTDMMTVTTTLDGPDLFAIDMTSDGVCNDQIAVPSGPIFTPIPACSLRSAIKTALETTSSDLIVFAAPISGTVITLKGNGINWAASDTTVDGQGRNIVISGAAMNADQDMIVIGGSRNRVRNVALTGARRHALVVGDVSGVGEGNDNAVEGSSFYGNVNGIAISIVGSVSGGRDNVVYNNTLGLPSGDVCQPARSNGTNIQVSSGAANTAVESNRVFCASFEGIGVTGADTSGTRISANRIGYGTLDTQRFGNATGMRIEDAKRTTVSLNYFRGNVGSGLEISGAATNNVLLESNTIGDVERAGPNPLAGENGADGVTIANVPSAAITFRNNTVLGNTRDGVRIENSSNITLTANTFGFDTSMIGSRGRNANGISILGASQRVRVLTNTIANNENLGVLINGIGTSGNGVAGNRIHSNQNSGVEISGGATFNVIGAEVYSFLGVLGVSGNSIFSNTREGVVIAGIGTDNNLVVANTIGGYADQIFPNGQNGVLINDRASANQIGAVVAGLDLANYIGGNGANGVWIKNGANNTSVVANRIGMIGDLSRVAGNGANGILLSDTTSGNVIGGAAGARQNVISNNARDGIALSGSTVSGDTVGVNYISRNTGNGVGIYDGAAPSGVGEPGGWLFISQNRGSGVYSRASNANTFQHVQTTGNEQYGFMFDGGSGNTLLNVGANNNGFDGIAQRNGAANNAWSELRTGSNGGLGIDLDADTDAGNIPAASTITVTAFTTSTGVMTIVGLNANTAYEVYLADPDPSGYGEGARVSVAFATGSLMSSANVTIPADDRNENCFTVLKTAAQSSEFSKTYCKRTPQSIDFRAPSDRTLAQPLSFRVVATATSGLPVTWTSDTPAVCTVAPATGVVTILTAGTCQLLAAQQGDAAFGAAMTQARAFLVSLASQTTTFAQPADMPLTAGALTVTASASSGLPVTFGGGAAGVCSVTAAGGVTLLGPGPCVITALQPGNAMYAPAPPVTRTFAVRRAVLLPQVRR